MNAIRRWREGPLEAQLLVGLLLVDLLLTGVYVLFQLSTGRAPRILDLNGEANIPAWWSANLLLLAGLLLLRVAAATLTVARRAWLLAGFGFLLVTMSMDEISGVHDSFGFVLDRVLVHRSETIFERTGLWFAVVGVPFAILVAVVLRSLYGLLEMVPGTVRRIAAGIVLLLCGAVGMEAVGSFVPDQLYYATIAVEEFLEMAGGSVILWASFGFARGHWSTRSAPWLTAPIARAPRRDETRPAEHSVLARDGAPTRPVRLAAGR